MDERRRLYSETRQDLLNRQLSNTQNYDRAILSLSTAALGFSLAFIKDLVVLNDSSHVWLLFSSWGFFVIAIIMTLLSFVTSQKAIEKQLYFAEQYYLNEREEFIKKKNWMSYLTDWIFYSSSVVFITAVFLTVLFVKINILGGSK